MKSIQSIYDEKTETELITQGKFSKKNNSYHISYEDSEATGFKGSVTEILVTENKFASIIRTGSTSSDLIIDQAKSITATMKLIRFNGYRYLHSLHKK